MSTSTALPFIGAALSLESFILHRDWFLGAQRDLELQNFFRGDVLDGDVTPLIAQTKAALDGYTGRLGIHGPFWGFKIDSQDSLVQAAVTTRFLQGLDACEKIGATQMVIHSPFTTWDYNNLDYNPGSRTALAERVHKVLGPVVKRAEDIGCELVIENIEDKDPSARVLLVETFNSKAVRVSIDTGHAHYAHISTGAPPVDYYVEAAGNLLTHVHLQDTEGYADRHWNPGEGTINWRAVFRSLSRLTSNPRLVLEVRDQTKLMGGYEFLVAEGLGR